MVNAKRTIASAPSTSRSDNVIDNDASTAVVVDVRATHCYPATVYRNTKLKIVVEITIIMVGSCFGIPMSV